MKILIGLVAALLIGWVWHGPLGHGAQMVERLEAEARQKVAQTELPGIRVAFPRNPLARAATLSGPANDLQREGLGSQKGLSDHVRDVEGVSSVRWADQPGGRIVPLLVETLGLVALAYLIGLGLGWLLWGRRRDEDHA
ncbi:MAG TPA: hypothetical protein VFR28_05075 [Allosphingosinicella sp.]|jgi:hypothetical protein|nr:hypothetical protein [Allosphingosinicella sp.]